MLRIAVGRIPASPGSGGDDVAGPAWLGLDERRRWTTLSRAARVEFAASRALLRRLLEAATGVPAERWDISAEAGTAPVARRHHAADAADAPHVSLSHRAGWVAAALATGPVGVDVECDRPVRTDSAERAAFMLAPSELPGWQALAPEEREADLLTRWAAKEAWFKASAAGSVPWDFRHVVACACAPAQANVRTWRSPPLHVAVSCSDVPALADALCDGLPIAPTASTFWRVALA